MSQQLTLPQLTALANQLPPAERRQLAETILRELAGQEPADLPRRRFWREIRGALPYGLYGDDAQAWVSRSREAIELYLEPEQEPVWSEGGLVEDLTL